MSRAFTSEEYEAPEIVYVKGEERKASADAELVFSYSKGRDFSDPRLPYEIGMHFLDGDSGFFASTEFAVKWLKMASGMGCVQAMVPLADLFLADTKTYGYRSAAVLLRKAADAGDEEAVKRLDMGSVSDPTSKKTYTVYRLNAELGDADAMFLLAEGFAKGFFGKNKEKAAALWFLRAFGKGRKDAKDILLSMNKEGRIAPSDGELGLLKN